MRNLFFIILFIGIVGGCKEVIPTDSIVISMENTDKWKFDEKNGWYEYDAKAPDSLIEFERRSILAFTPDTASVQTRVNYKAIKRQIIPIDSLRKEQVKKHLLYLYKKDDEKFGELAKIKKIDSLVLIRFPKTIYD